MRRAGLLGLALVALAGTGVPARAQLNYFGQNKIHYRGFEWQVLRGPHVDLYFYPEERELARVALAYAEESFDYLERKFGHSPRRRIPLIIYASHADFEQTNILPFVPPEGVLGVTEFLKSRVALPFNGNYSQFRHTLRHELVHAYQLSLVADTYLRHPRAGRPFLPLWWSEGLAEYWSEGEDALDEMVLRELTVSGRMPRLRQLTYVFGGVVYPLGGAIHRWLSERYGDWRVQVLYRDLWKYRTFDEALEGVYGVPIEQLENELQFHFQQTYFPVINERRPLTVTANTLAKVAAKPLAYTLPGDSITRYMYLSPHTGYMNIYEGVLNQPGRRRIMVKGERSAQFQSFHAMASRFSVQEGVVAFSSRYLERDALYFWDVRKRRVVGRYQFEGLVSILSPSWAPDGESVVFSGLSMSGLSDLYRVWLPEGRLERLTNDRFQDVDPSVSPDGTSVVFASDRTRYGPDGGLNLYLLDLETGDFRYLTFGPWRDQGPRWAQNGRIYFSSDRDGVYDIYSTDARGNGRRETRTLTGAFDPQWVESENLLLFGGWGDLSFNIYRAYLQPDTIDAAELFALAEEAATDGREAATGSWTWPELTESPYAKEDPQPYRARFALDFAAGDVIVIPGTATAQGLVFRFSDLLSDQLLFLAATSFQGRDVGDFVENINATVFYLNRKRRLNWGLGGFRVRGVFFEGDFRTQYEEKSTGGYIDLRWPISRFSRIQGQFRLEYSKRFDPFIIEEPFREGLLASNILLWVHDNTLWLPTGPIDGQRTNLTGSITNDLTNGRFDAWMLSLDHRRYLRAGRFAAYAVRLYGYVAGGNRPRRVSIGGPWGLRGYPRTGGISGTRAFLFNNELRFPLLSFLTFGTPLGPLRFPGIQSALFLDFGGAWSHDDAPNRGVLGSGGFGFRMGMGGALVLRLDMGWRFDLTGRTGAQILDPGFEEGWFTSFFFGFNY
jgi:Tol biopolymer transport system component